MDSSRPLLIRSLAILAVGVLVAALCLFASPDVTQSSHVSLRLGLPDTVGSWTGKDEPISEAEKTILPADTGFARKRYQDYLGETILASIVLAGAEKRSIHRPEICLPGQGWKIDSSSVVPIPLNDSAKPLEATRLLLSRPIRLRDGQAATLQACMLYWYVGDEVTTPLHWKRIWLTAWDRVVHHRNHRWAYVYVLAPITKGLVPAGKDGEETLGMLREFIAGALPTFQDVR
ncbi:MAG TPA: EpsI family protein [Candidatus Methylacidiphilales bacterium]